MIEKKNDDKQQTLTTGCFCFFIIKINTKIISFIIIKKNATIFFLYVSCIISDFSYVFMCDPMNVDSELKEAKKKKNGIHNKCAERN